MKKIISNQLSPNFSFLQSLDVLKSFFSRKNNPRHKDFVPYFGDRYLLSTHARSFLREIPSLFCLPKDKKIAIPAFTCGVVATPFLSQGYDIEWIDTTNDGLMDFNDFQKKSVTSQTGTLNISAIIYIHTFGQQADTRALYDYCQQKGILFIEDTSHSFTVGNTDVRDVEITSFGREKSLSCVSGGMVRWNKKHDKIFQSLGRRLCIPSVLWSFQYALHPFLLSLCIAGWYQGVRYVAWVFSRLKILPRACSVMEQKGIDDGKTFGLPRAQQYVLLKQCQKYRSTIVSRKKIAKKWEQVLKKYMSNVQIIVPENFFRVIIQFPSEPPTKQIQNIFRQYGIVLDDWNGHPISPRSVSLKSFGYRRGQCPNADCFSKTHIVLPTHTRISTEYIEIFAEKVLSHL